MLEFTQQDLLPEDVFILDDYDRLFIWVGNDARPEEKTMANDTVMVSVEKDVTFTWICGFVTRRN